MEPEILQSPNAQAENVVASSDSNEIKKSNKYSKLRIVLIALIIIVVGIGIFIMYKNGQKSDNVSKSMSSPKSISPTASISGTSGWKTYVNKLIGYSLNYPDTYTMEEIPEPNYFSVKSPSSKNIREPNSKGDDLTVSILAYNALGDVTLDKIISDDKLGSVYTDGTPTEGKNYQIKLETVNGIEAVYRTGAKDPPDAEEYIFIKNGYILSITKFPKVTSRQSEFEQILSSFKFTK